MSPKVTSTIFLLWATIGVVSVIFRWPWVPLLLALIIVVVYATQRLLRWQSLMKKGYAIHWLSGGYLFEEMYQGFVRSLKLSFSNTEPGHWEFFVPSEDQWRSSVPDWAQDRRIEIVQRITQKCRSNDVHYPKDWNA